MLAPTSLSALGKHSEIPLGLFFTTTIVHIMVRKVFVSLCSSWILALPMIAREGDAKQPLVIPCFFKLQFGESLGPPGHWQACSGILSLIAGVEFHACHTRTSLMLPGGGNDSIARRQATFWEHSSWRRCCIIGLIKSLVMNTRLSLPVVLRQERRHCLLPHFSHPLAWLGQCIKQGYFGWNCFMMVSCLFTLPRFCLGCPFR